MSYGQYLLFFMAVTIITWSLFISFVIYNSPDDNFLTIILFYLNLGIALTSVFVLLSTVVRVSILQRPAIENEIRLSLRRSFFFASGMIYILILQHNSIVSFQNIAIFVIAVTIIELLCLLSQNNSQTARINN